MITQIIRLSILIFKLFFILTALNMLFITSAHSQSSTTIKGFLFGADDKPMKKSDIIIRDMNLPSTFGMCEVKPDGSFLARIDRVGKYELIFYGVHHEKLIIPVIIDEHEDISIKVRLSKYKLKRMYRNLFVTNEENKYSLKKPIKMKKQKNGSFSVEIKTKAKQFAYKIFGADEQGKSIEGTISNDYIFEGDGYKSILYPINGKVIINFSTNPADTGSRDSEIEFANEKSRIAKYACIHSNLRKFDNALSNSFSWMNKKDTKSQKFKFEWKNAVDELIHGRFNEDEPFNNKCKEFLYLCLFRLDINSMDPEMILKCINDIGPVSSFWTLDPEIINYIYRYSDISIKHEIEKMTDEMLFKNRDYEVFANAIYLKISIACEKKDFERADILKSLMEIEYPGTKWAERVKKDFKFSRPVPGGSCL